KTQCKDNKLTKKCMAISDFIRLRKLGLLLLFNKKVKLNSWQKRGKQLTLHPTNKSGLRFF
ncbi:hypothetical protein, partial [Bacteroides uniformis]|uniref:hypothetical protein n=1 Tax=Bacteroides uniformis TaxID=820 RepID=UPI00195FE351